MKHFLSIFLIVFMVLLSFVKAKETELIRLLKASNVKQARALLLNMISGHGDTKILVQFKEHIKYFIRNDTTMLWERPSLDRVRWQTFRTNYIIPKIKTYINQKDKAGRTALHYAAALLDIKLALMLIGLGAIGHIRDGKGNMPTHIAIINAPKYKNQKHTFFIGSIGADLLFIVNLTLKNDNNEWNDHYCNAPNKKGETIVHFLAYNSIGVYILNHLINDNFPMNIACKDAQDNTIVTIIQQRRTDLEKKYTKEICDDIGHIQVTKEKRDALKAEYGKEIYYEVANLNSLILIVNTLERQNR